MIILNLGCGLRTSDNSYVVNIDWSPYLRIRKGRLLRFFAPLIVRGRRADRYGQLPENILVHDLSKGIPFDDNSVDVVYHSHMFEHLDLNVGRRFLSEVFRVLKVGGVHRIVVPDLESLCRDYLRHLDLCISGESEWASHDEYVAEILEQCVRREAAGTRNQRPLRRWLENRILGDARKRGETHQWMYDRVNLSAALTAAGFSEVILQDFDQSIVSQWNELGLDRTGDGQPYKSKSLYLEAVK